MNSLADLDPITVVHRVSTIDEWGCDFLLTPRAQWLPDFLKPLIPERDYNASLARVCIKQSRFVVGEAANEYAELVQS